MTPRTKGEKERINRSPAAGNRVNREAQPVESMTPGLSEKLTGPTMPRIPDKIFARPVNVMPRLILCSIFAGLNISDMDSMEPRSLMDRARKQKRKETRTPGLKDNCRVRFSQKPATRGAGIAPPFWRETGKTTR